MPCPHICVAYIMKRRYMVQWGCSRCKLFKACVVMVPDKAFQKPYTAYSIHVYNEYSHVASILSLMYTHRFLYLFMNQRHDDLSLFGKTDLLAWTPYIRKCITSCSLRTAPSNNLRANAQPTLTETHKFRYHLENFCVRFPPTLFIDETQYVIKWIINRLDLQWVSPPPTPSRKC